MTRCKHAVHYADASRALALCGRRIKVGLTYSPEKVTCKDCLKWLARRKNG